MYLITLDIGTTGCKSAVFDSCGMILGESYIEYSLITLGNDMIEQDANMWWELSCKAIREAVAASKVDRSEKFAIGISSQGISFVPVDKDLNPLCNGISWLDTRASVQVSEILKEFDGEYLFNVTGKRVSAGYVLPKLLWLRQNRQEIYNSTFKMLMTLDFVLAKLTGKFFTDHTMACGTLMYDITKNCWCEEILDAFNISQDLLPEICWGTESAGNLTQHAAQALGLPQDTIVSVGGQDQKVAALGANIDSKTLTISMGTAGALEFLIDKPLMDKTMSLPCHPNITMGTWVLEGVVSTTGACLKWLKNTLLPDFSYKELDTMCEDSPVGANGLMFFPHLAGASTPIWNTQVKGSVYGITLSTTRQDLVMSVFEGIAYQIKSNIECAKSLGALTESIRIFGGGAKSDIWCKIISNVTGMPVLSFSSPEIASYGAALLAISASGIDNKQIVSAAFKDCRTHYPDPDKFQIYQSLYRDYIELEKGIVSTITKRFQKGSETA